MKQQITQGIVLGRTDFGEADRIITMLTPDHGKLRLMARGVRRVKSKLAGGIELFSVSDITYIAGRGDIGTLVSTRLDRHYGNIIKELERVQLGYEVMKLLNKTTEDNPEPEYFDLLRAAYAALDDPSIDRELIQVWFQAQLIKLAGHTPNLETEADGRALHADLRYHFDIDEMTFAQHPSGNFAASTIKALRLHFGEYTPSKLQQVQGMNALSIELLPLFRTLSATYL